MRPIDINRAIDRLNQAQARRLTAAIWAAAIALATLAALVALDVMIRANG